MNRHARVYRVLLLIVCALMTGCLFSNKPKAAQAPPLPAPTPSTTPAAQTPAAQTPAAQTPAPNVPKSRTVQQKKPVAPAQTPSQSAATTPALPPAPSPAPPAPEASPAQLREILTPQQRAELIRNLDQSLAAARESLSRVAGRPMTRDQAETARLATSFAAQAESARPTDLIVAAQLARRAELLARELVNLMH